VEAVPSAKSLLEKENGIEGVSRKISMDPICENVEFASLLRLLMGSQEVGQISTQAIGSHHPGRKRRDFSRVLPKTKGAIGLRDDIPIRWVLRIVGEELLQVKYFWKGAGAKSVGIPEVGPVAKWSKAEAILDKSPSSSEKSGSESEEVVELRRAKEAHGRRNPGDWARLEGGRSRGGGGRIRSWGYCTRGQSTERAPGLVSRRMRGPFDGEIGASRGNITRQKTCLEERDQRPPGSGKIQGPALGQRRGRVYRLNREGSP
jgi:hypothetical protein